MPDPKLTKPWYGIPREEIDWHPTINEDVCIGCGTCVSGCGRSVYRFDFGRKKAVVADPLNCLVGCTTCANVCPSNAISFPSLQTVADLLAKPAVHHAIEDDLLGRKEQLAWQEALPRSEHLLQLVVEKITRVNERTLLVTLKPRSESDCTCQFIPGQYLELWVPGGRWMSRAYSIGNAPDEDGSVELHLRRVEGGRFTTWAFEHMRVGDVLDGRGPLGNFCVRSPIDTPLLFVARGVGFAPIKAMIEQQLKLVPDRDIALFWGVTDTSDFYHLNDLQTWATSNANFYCVLTARADLVGFKAPIGVIFQLGTVYNALATSLIDLSMRDAYVAGPRKTVQAVVDVLVRKGIPRDRILVDAYGG